MQINFSARPPFAQGLQPARVRWSGIVLALLLMAVMLSLSACQPTALASQVEAQASLPATMSVQQAAARRAAGAFVLDVRTPAEYQEYHIPGSVLIPLDQLQGRLAEVPRDREIVVVCRSGNRSATGRDILLRAGFPRVTSMAGGLLEWRKAGLPVQ